MVLVVILPLRHERRRGGANLRIFEDFTFVIPDNDFLVVVLQNVTGIDRDLATTARCTCARSSMASTTAGGVDDILRH